MNKISYILLLLAFFCSLESIGQGQISRPTQQQSQTGKPQKSIPKVTVSEPDGYINGYGYVDLGLPSRIKWATCNVGASQPSDNGNYYAWGELATKSSYDKDNSLTYGKSISELQSQGIINTSQSLSKSHDAASENLKSSWRMPTDEEWQELKERCKWVWGGNSQKGYKITGPNGRSIFLPAAGWYYGSTQYEVGNNGSYWSSTPFDDFSEYAYHFFFKHSLTYLNHNIRSNGNTIRAVSK